MDDLEKRVQAAVDAAGFTDAQRCVVAACALLGGMKALAGMREDILADLDAYNREFTQLAEETLTEAGA
ncbi:hypothetical protein [Roseomonas sp. WA12]